MSKFQPSLEEGSERGQMVQAEVIPRRPPNRKAFLSAPPTVDTSVLRRAMEERGIVPFELDEVAAGGRSIPELLEDCLKRADFVVVVVGDGKAKDNVLFELGFAMALKKRILAIVSPDADPPLSGILYLRTLPDNREAVEFGLDQILKAPKPRRHPRRKGIRKTKPLGPLADKLLDRIRGSEEPLGKQDLEQILREVIEESGIDSAYYASERMVTPISRADMAIWSDDFEPWVGNPLPIKLKSHPRSRSELQSALDELTQILDNTHSEWGLLIYQGADFEPSEQALGDPRVFVLTIERLLESLRDTSLGDFLHRMRNLRVHGRG
jgi:hypothetical protein